MGISQTFLARSQLGSIKSQSSGEPHEYGIFWSHVAIIMCRQMLRAPIMA